MARKTTSSGNKPSDGEAAEENGTPRKTTADSRASGQTGTGGKDGATGKTTGPDTEKKPASSVSRDGKAPDGAPGPGSPKAPPDARSGVKADTGTEKRADSSEAVDDKARPAGSAKPEPLTPAPVTTEQVVIRKGGFLPLLLGGAAAAAIGFAAALFGFSQGWSVFGGARNESFQAEVDQRLTDQSARLQDMSDRFDSLPSGPDEGGLGASVSDLEASVASLTDRISAAETQLVGVVARLAEIEQASPSGAISDEAVTSYESELAALREAVAEQRAVVEEITAEARQIEEEAQATAAATLQRAALTRIQTAIDSGTGFASALADLRAAGVEPPAELAEVAESGVEPLADLQTDFPDAARAALAASRANAAEEGDMGGFTAFLRTQLGARSLEPREGNDPDAILSRAEAATRDGRLRDALAEIEALPEAGRAELSGWTERANRRLAAVAAAQQLSEKLN